MDIEKAYPTHEIGRGPKNLKLLLARNRHGLEAILYSTFYYAESNTYILFLVFFFCKTSNNSFAIFTINEFDCILTSKNRNTIFRKGDHDFESF
jgi:hypothetical protein